MLSKLLLMDCLKVPFLGELGTIIKSQLGDMGLSINDCILGLEIGSISRSVVSHSVTPWTVARQASLFMGFSRQIYWSGLLCSPPGDLPNPGLLHCRQTFDSLSHQGNPIYLGFPLS